MNDTEKLRLCQLKIVNEIKRICEKNDIQYFLDCGSMLGAVRHQGFIPWDDDVDIGMTDPNYQKFLKACEMDLKPPYFLDNYKTNPDNALVFSKIRLLGTCYIENKADQQAQHSEIFVDIFPYYNRSENVFARKIEGTEMAVLAQAIMSKAGYKVWKGEGLCKRIKFIPTDILGKICTRSFLYRQVERLYQKNKGSGLLGMQGGSAYGYWYFPKDVFDDYVVVPFENEHYPIPKQYDRFLKTAYGNYMQLPPENQRVTHQIQKLDFGNIQI